MLLFRSIKSNVLPRAVRSHRNRWRIEVSIIMREEGQVGVQGEDPVDLFEI